LFSGSNPPVPDGQPEGLIESGTVGLLDDFEQFRQVAEHGRRLDHLVKGQRLQGVRLYGQHRLRGGLLPPGVAIREAMTWAGMPASSPSRCLASLCSHSTTVTRAREIAGSSRFLLASATTTSRAVAAIRSGG
jgi:hypothetical protein